MNSSSSYSRRASNPWTRGFFDRIDRQAALRPVPADPLDVRLGRVAHIRDLLPRVAAGITGSSSLTLNGCTAAEGGK